jgi:hypothetical protein
MQKAADSWQVYYGLPNPFEPTKAIPNQPHPRLSSHME